MTTYYLTKYALTDCGNPIACEGNRPPDEDGDVFLVLPGSMAAGLYRVGRDAFTDPGEAHAAILKARDKKIASLEKQIAKLRAIG